MNWCKTLACLLPIALAGCGALGPARLGVGLKASGLQARQAGEASLAQLYPVPVGARWAYRLSQVQGDAPPREASMLVAIAEAQGGPEGTTARLDRRFGQMRAPSTRVSIGPSGVRLARWVEADPSASLSVMVAPLAPGQGWAGRPFTGGNREWVVAGGWSQVETPAGSFRARQVTHELHYADGVVQKLEYWYAPGLGMVKMVERARMWLGGQEILMRSEGLLVGAVGLPVGSVGEAPPEWQPGPPAAPGQVGGAEAIGGLRLPTLTQP